MLNIIKLNLITKIILKIAIFLIGFWSFLLNSYASTIESTIDGGTWNDPNTWLGGIIPGYDDNIVINGVVDTQWGGIYNGNLTITENGYLYGSNWNSTPNLTINGNLINNGIIGGNNTSWRKFYLNVKGKVLNNGEISNLYLYIFNDIENNGDITEINLGSDISISKKQNLNLSIFLNGFTLKVPKDTYINYLSGDGEINSNTSENGDLEYIYFGETWGSIKSNFEYMNSKNRINSGFQIRNTIIDNTIGSQWLGTINGNLIIRENGYLYGINWNTTPDLIINGNLINNGIIGGNDTSWRRFDLNVKGKILNNGEISNIQNFYLSNDIENNGAIANIFDIFITWDYFDNYSDYYIDFSDIGLREVNNSNIYYILSNRLLKGTSYTWNVKGNGIFNDLYDTKGFRCVNIEGCINIKGEPEKIINNQIPTPTNLNQYIKSPLLEKEEIEVGSKIGKFQSGSGVIFETEIDNPESKELRLNIELYKKGETITKQNYTSDYFTSSGKVFTKILLSEGDYYWNVKIEDRDGNASEIVDFKNNGTDTDFSIFEGFEPYPYGFKFNNGEPNEGILKGGISYLSLGENITSKYIRKIEDGNLWDLFYKTFDTSDFVNNDKKLMDAFESVGLINGNVFKGGNCYGLAYLSLLNIYKPEYIEQNFPTFFEEIKNGDLYNSIDVPSAFGNGKWDIYNETLKTILTLYLTQNSSQHKRTLLESQLTPNELLTTLSNPDNKNKLYLLSIYGEDKNGNTKGHTVFPYRVEGNKIYIVDNNVAYPDRFINKSIGLKKSYEQYIEINGIGTGTWDSQLYSQLGRTKFTDLSLMKIEDLYNGGIKSKPFGFAVNDSLYTLSGSSDIILTDSIGRKSGYLNGEIFKEIPGVLVDMPLDTDILGNFTENTFKQIYLQQKLENLTIEINGKVDENYDLMIAGGDYYTKLEGITTSSGQTDIFNISRENIKVDLDNTKTNSGTYNILVDDFQNNSTGSIYLYKLETIKEKQELDINWLEVLNNNDFAIIYSKDLNNDGIKETKENLKSIIDYSIKKEKDIKIEPRQGLLPKEKDIKIEPRQGLLPKEKESVSNINSLKETHINKPITNKENIEKGTINGRIEFQISKESCEKLGIKNCQKIIKQIGENSFNKNIKLFTEIEEDKNVKNKKYIELGKDGNYKINDLSSGLYKLGLEFQKGFTTKNNDTLLKTIEINNKDNYINKEIIVINELLEQFIKKLKTK